MQRTLAVTTFRCLIVVGGRLGVILWKVSEQMCITAWKSIGYGKYDDDDDDDDCNGGGDNDTPVKMPILRNSCKESKLVRSINCLGRL